MIGTIQKIDYDTGEIFRPYGLTIHKGRIWIDYSGHRFGTLAPSMVSFIDRMEVEKVVEKLNACKEGNFTYQLNWLQ